MYGLPGTRQARVGKKKTVIPYGNNFWCQKVCARKKSALFFERQMPSRSLLAILFEKNEHFCVWDLSFFIFCFFVGRFQRAAGKPWRIHEPSASRLSCVDSLPKPSSRPNRSVLVLTRGIELRWTECSAKTSSALPAKSEDRPWSSVSRASITPSPLAKRRAVITQKHSQHAKAFQDRDHSNHLSLAHKAPALLWGVGVFDGEY